MAPNLVMILIVSLGFLGHAECEDGLKLLSLEN